jgi:integrase
MESLGTFHDRPGRHGRAPAQRHATEKEQRRAHRQDPVRPHPGHQGRAGRPVTIYKRGGTYSLYYRERGATKRCKLDGGLAVARATASKVAAALGENRPSPVGHSRTAPDVMVAGFLGYVAQVQRLAPRTQDRYRAALDRLLEFCKGGRDRRGGPRGRDDRRGFRALAARPDPDPQRGRKGKRDAYKTGGIKFILSTCRTAFNWAGKRRMLAAFAPNPFSSFPIDKLRDRDAGEQHKHVFSPAQEAAFFRACDDWQLGIFTALASLGLGVGELAHLLVEDVDFEAGVIEVRSKPELFWNVKTGRRRQLPLVPVIRELLTRLIGDRKAGFVFLNEEFAAGRARPAVAFALPRAFLAHLRKVTAELLTGRPDAPEKERRRAVMAICRTLGQIPEKRVRGEFMKLTRHIGCPEFTRAHDLRHLFSSRAQEAGMNPLLVQELLGHTTLDMTRRYTHLGMDAKREAFEKLSPTPGSPDQRT